MIYYPLHEIFRHEKLLDAFQTLRTILIEATPIEVTPYFTYARHKTHKTLVISLIQYPYCPTIYS